MNSKIMTLGVLCTLPIFNAYSDLQTKPLPPQDTVRRILSNYNSVKNDCKESDTGAARGHYYCSGVSIRMVNDGPFNPWDYSNWAIQTGATSWTWLRRDLSITMLMHPAGFIMRNPADSVALKLPVKEDGFTCIYSFDAGTGPDRKWYGCGQSGAGVPSNAGKPPINNKNGQWAYGSCKDQGVRTTQEWINTYTTGWFRSIQKEQCSWSAEDPAGWDEMIKIHEYRTNTDLLNPYAINTATNEFMLRNASATNDGSLNMQYIDAFVYNAKSNYNYQTMGDTAAQKPEDGLTVARNFQKKLYAKGYHVPIIWVDFTKPATERFGYSAADQAIPFDTSTETGGPDIPAAQSGTYIASTQWVERFDPGTQKNEWSLQVTPTERGRNIGPEETEAMYNELWVRNGSNQQWQENEMAKGSMRRQLVCLLTQYRTKDQWFLEPFRPYVTHEESVAAECNPVAASSAGHYISQAKWVLRFDPGTGKDEWSLEVTPTETGRSIREDQTEAMYNELVARNGQDPQWRDNEKSQGSMRRQFVCLLTAYRSKPQWYLEPYRPYVTHQDAVAAGCNPL
ncbi:MULTISPECIES: DUF2599 domain-containing protein [unclassified Pseudomonas]|uniref:DUF2599 domain-containing protein n=1 Tax=unclassified Pseudomonas TaxID=196821 RepID=UPI0013315070|nr:MULTISPECIES: DUF2599 domain-containing protein [unclassified Pseudomonas]MBS7601341.1 DUF2599 domain-containing protein [Pseudomonas sp. RC2C2]